VVHDALCWLKRNGWLKQYSVDEIDAFMYVIHIEDKACHLRARYYQWGLNFVDSYADPKNKKKIYESP